MHGCRHQQLHRPQKRGRTKVWPNRRPSKIWSGRVDYAGCCKNDIIIVGFEDLGELYLTYVSICRAICVSA